VSRVLLPIDPAQPARTRSAIEEVLRLRVGGPVTVRLLRVQPQVSGHVAMFFGTRELQALQERTGAEDLEFAQNLLALAGVPYASTVLVGRSAETIVQAARDYHCDRIIFGREEPGLTGRIFGSLAQQVRQMLDASENTQVVGS
jgi:nucleotide-binding universal stress UspA family protein